MRLVLALTIAAALPIAALSVAAPPAAAQEGATPPRSGPPQALSPRPPAEPAMTLTRMARILEALDPDLRRRGASFEMVVADVPVLVVADPAADRMRAMVPIRAVADMAEGELLRVMQANFDSALDARYAVARGRLWSVYIHPLSPLERDQLISGLAQAVNVAASYGTSYSGGAMAFGGGDTAEMRRRALIEELLRRGRDI